MRSVHKEDKQDYVHRVFERISGSYDAANDRISLGFQRYWKEMLIKHLSEFTPYTASFLDICCGTGDIAIAAAKKRPDMEVIGADFSSSMLKVAKKKSRGLKNVHWKRADALRLPWPDESFDAVCISFGLRNTVDYKKVISEMKRVVKKGGFVYCLDSFVPENKLVLPFYRLYFRFIMPFLGGGVKHINEYRWLYRSTQLFVNRGQLVDLYSEVGLRNIKSRNRMFGACSMVWGQK